MKNNSKFLQTVTFLLSYASCTLLYKRGEEGVGMNKGLNCDIGQLFTRNYRKIKTGFTFAFSYLNLQAILLVTYNFEQVIISRNYSS